MFSTKPGRISESILLPFPASSTVKFDDDTNGIDNDEGDPDGNMVVMISDISGVPIVGFSNDKDDASGKVKLDSGVILGSAWLMDIESDIDILKLILPDNGPNI